MENGYDEASRLRRCLGDLASLSALPSVWIGYDPVRAAESLAGVLLHMLDLDFVCVSMRGPSTSGECRLVHSSRGSLSDERGREVTRTLAPWLEATPRRTARSAPDPFGDGTVRLIAFPLGCDGEFGLVGAGARRPEFPTEGERLVLGVGVNLAAVIIQRRLAEEALRRSEERFTRFMRHLPGLAWIKDSRGRYVYANDAAERAFGRPRERLYGRNDEEVFPPDTADQFKENDRRALESGAGVQVVETLEHEDGIVHHSVVSKFAIPSPDGEEVLIGGMAVDITDRLRMEEALRVADRRKDEFLATMAHELRSPLAPIRNAVKILKARGAPDPEVAWAREVIDRQAAQMARLLDDLLDVSRIGRSKLELRRQRVMLAAVVEDAVETSRPLIQAGGHDLSIVLPDGAIDLEVDPVRLAQVLSNLLNNAAKYTESGGRIRLIAERMGHQVVISVTDSGIGIAPEMLPRLFEMFSQAAPALERSQGGLGIGLSLVKGLVEMHGGTVEARSDGPGRGSEFIVRLPIPVAPRVQEQPPAEVERPCLAGCKLVVADDNRDAADSLAMMLTIMGNEVRTAYDGEQAVEQAEALRPDVVLLDIGMPRLNGYEAACRIRGQPWGQDMLLVALTGWGQDEDKRRAAEAGFNAHLVKPVEPDALERLLGSVVAHQRA